MPMTVESLVARWIAEVGEAPTEAGKVIQQEAFTKQAKAFIDEVTLSGSVTVAAGIAVSTTGTAAAQTGATTAAGAGTIS